jgi:hypothetical protein
LGKFGPFAAEFRCRRKTYTYGPDAAENLSAHRRIIFMPPPYFFWLWRPA